MGRLDTAIAGEPYAASTHMYMTPCTVKFMLTNHKPAAANNGWRTYQSRSQACPQRPAAARAAGPRRGMLAAASSRGNTQHAPAAERVPCECQQNSSTVMWWYQCRKRSGFLRSTMKTVSMSSGTLDQMNAAVQNPVMPQPYQASAPRHTWKQRHWCVKV